MKAPAAFDPERFLEAQRSTYDSACAELAAGRKRSHWMWFIFPQIAGLGFSGTARKYAIASLEEARAYLAHPVLGPRLVHATKLVNHIEGCSIQDIFGSPDWMKFRSCMTLFAHATHDNGAYVEALEKYFAGEEDAATLARLNP